MKNYGITLFNNMKDFQNDLSKLSSHNNKGILNNNQKFSKK